MAAPLRAPQAWNHDVVEVDDAGNSGRPADVRFERALAGLPCWVQDAAVLRHCTGPNVARGGLARPRDLFAPLPRPG